MSMKGQEEEEVWVGLRAAGSPTRSLTPHSRELDSSVRITGSPTELCRKAQYGAHMVGQRWLTEVVEAMRPVLSAQCRGAG